MKKVLVVDWLDKYGGSERVIGSFTSVYNFESCYTISSPMDQKHQDKVFSGKDIIVHESILKYFGKYFRNLFFLFPFAIRQFKISKDTDIIISSSHAIAKGIRKSTKNQLHISYFQARNLKYIWSDFQLYFGFLRFMMYPFVFAMRKIDKNQGQNPDYIVSNSQFVADWVLKTYNRKSVIIYPPVDVLSFALEKKKKDYYVAVGRLEPYKRFDIIIKAFNKNGKKLSVIGDGSQFSKLRKMSNSNIHFTGFLESDKIHTLISSARGFIHAGVEDFGIAPIEAQACGTPVIGFNEGGLKETVIHTKTGFLFEDQDIDVICKAIDSFEKIDFDYEYIRKHSLQFSRERFEKEFESYVSNCYQEFVSYKK